MRFDKRGQQEIVGFVVIVVLVVIAAFIFMVLSFGNKDKGDKSLEIAGLLDALLAQTTDCVVSEPLPLDIGGLIREAYGGSQNCNNPGITTRDALNSTIYQTMDNVMFIEKRFKAWQIDIYAEEDDVKIAQYYQGSCGEGQMIAAAQSLVDFRVEMSVCLN